MPSSPQDDLGHLTDPMAPEEPRYAGRGRADNRHRRGPVESITMHVGAPLGRCPGERQSGGGHTPSKPPRRQTAVSVALVGGGRERRPPGEGPPLARWGRRHPPEGSDGEYRSMSGEHAGPHIPRRRRPYAVNAARTVPTGGMETRAIRNRALSLPTLADADGALRTVNPLRRPPCAMNVARTVPTGGMERRVLGYRALSLPTKWCGKFGQDYANQLRRCRPRPGDKWHLDEVFLTINGERHYLWRAVDQDGNVLDILVQHRRDKDAAKRFFRKLLKGCQYVPRVIITDTLKSYGAAKREILPGVEHRQHRSLNHRAENSHQPTRQRERRMQGVKSPGHAQRFLSAYGLIAQHSRPRRHRLPAPVYRHVMAQRFQIWYEVTATTAA
jgi:putative transposase